LHNDEPEGSQPQEHGEHKGDAPVFLPVEASLDLHTFRPAEVEDLLDDYLEAACRHGLREVLIIHGKGQGILRRRVRSILSAHPRVVGFRDAEPRRGGWGAAVVELTAAGIGAAKPKVKAPGPGEESAPSSGLARADQAAEVQSALHHLSSSGLLVALGLGLGLGALFYRALLGFGASSMPALMPLYGLCASYGLIRKAARLRQVIGRAIVACIVLCALLAAALAVHRGFWG
jgi:hypothetical protein